MTTKAKHIWKARLAVGIIMLALAFFGMLTTDIRSAGGWSYWKWIVPLYALMALWLSWYVKRSKEAISPITIWHEALHWGALIATIFLVSHLVNLGTISRFVGGLFEMMLLGLALFLAGVYIEPIFLLIGTILGLFVWGTSFFVQYLYAITVPLLAACALIIIIIVWRAHKRG